MVNLMAEQALLELQTLEVAEALEVETPHLLVLAV
jgi:hypothetical protein